VASFLGSYKGLDRRITLLAAARAVNTMGFSIVMPFLAMYLVHKRGASGAVFGLVYLVSGLVAALGNAASGEAADRLGRRRVMLAALLLRAVNMAALGTAVLLEAPIVALGALVVLNGLLRSFFDPAAAAAVSELAPPERRAAAFALQRVGVNVGWALGPALGGALAVAHSYGALFYASGGVMLIAAFLVARLGDLGSPAAPAERLTLAGARVALARNRRFFVYLGLVFLGSILTVQIFATLSVYARTELGLSEQAIGLVYTVNGVLVVVLQLPAVVLIERGGPRRALIFGPLLYAIGFLAIGASHGFFQLALAMALITAAEVVFAPALSDMAAHLGDARHLGRAFGLFGLMQQLGLSVGPLVGGLLYDHLRHEPLAMWGAIAAAMAVLGVGYAAFARVYLGPRRT
jgi:predicted MFS family arabinose efflux permease